MNDLRPRLAAVVFAVLAVSCGGGTSTPTQPTTTTNQTAQTQAAVRDYLTRIFDLMRANSINRQTIDWEAFRAEVFGIAANAQSIAELNPAIRQAITLLRDGHTSYRSAAGTTIFVGLRSCVPEPVVAVSAPPNIGVIRITSFSGTTEAGNAFARQLQDTIAAGDQAGVIGWIVDLRSNGGGNMWPMLAGAGPILGDGALGYFITPVGNETMWEYRNGTSYSGSFPANTVSPPYVLRGAQPRVAVLSNIGVGSSGEATLIAFRLRPNTRSFGEASCGLSTSNQTFTLSDGATLNLTSAVMADRAKNRYGDRVVPDEVIPNQSDAIQRAIAWLQTGR